METNDSVDPLTPLPPEWKGEKISFVERYSGSIKLLVVAFLTLLLLIPLGMINGLINERKFTKSSAVHDITSKWSGEQIVTGPCIAIPYIQERVVNGRSELVTSDLLVFPEKLDVNGRVNVERRKRGIYDASVYQSEIAIEGIFDLKEAEKTGINVADIKFEESRIILGVTDLRGIREAVALQLNGSTFLMEPGIAVESLLDGPSPLMTSGVSGSEKIHVAPEVSTGVFSAGVNVRADSSVVAQLKAGKLPFSLTLYLNGSTGLYVIPLGKETTASISSDWSTPSFGGNFLPANHEIGEEGFTANWKVLDLNRSYGQSVRADDISSIQQVTSSLFGVKFIQSVDQYQQNSRSVKYGVLIILLTFVVVFFIELIKKNPVNPFHYLLVGLALVLFYALLLSMSEIWGFSLAYAVAAIMTIVMIIFHMRAILKSGRQGLLVGGLLAILYAFVFLLIRMESYSLLVGSLGLFVILGVIMYFARKIKM